MTKTTIKILFFLLLLIPFFGKAQVSSTRAAQIVINSDRINAAYSLPKSIVIFTTKNHIVLNGNFVCRFRNPSDLFISIKPSEKLSIRILPTLMKAKSTSIGFEEDDDDTHNSSTISRITVSPNPTKTKTTINTLENISKIEVFDSYGFLQLTTNNNTIDLSNHKNGIYIVKIHLKNSKVVTKTIVKQ